MHKLFLTLVAFLHIHPTLVFPADFIVASTGKLNQLALKKAYKEAEWDQVTKALESYLRKKGDNMVGVEERIFAYKFLGVIYAADSMTQLKAESYFSRLLDLASDMEIVDLYASKRVNELFRETKREHQERQAFEHKMQGKSVPLDGFTGVRPALGEKNSDSALATHSPSRRQDSSTQSSQLNVSSKEHPWAWWAIGAVAIVGASAGIYYIFQPDKVKVVEVTRVEPGNP